jgi:hypothetical protein
MHASIIVGPKGVERVVSVGQGLEPAEASLLFLDLIWDEVQQFHAALLRKIERQGKKGESKTSARGSER